MIERLMKMGIRVNHAWGMTETRPIGTMGAPFAGLGRSELRASRSTQVCKQGKVPYGVELRVVDDEGRVQPRDGKSSGRLQVRGPWVDQDAISRRSEAPQSMPTSGSTPATSRCSSPDGTIADHRPRQGRDQVGRRVDQLGRPRECRGRLYRRGGSGGDRRRTIPSGTSGRSCWWSASPAATSRREQVQATSGPQHVAKWWLPDEVHFVESLPHTATGKCSRPRSASSTRISSWPRPAGDPKPPPAGEKEGPRNGERGSTGVWLLTSPAKGFFTSRRTPPSLPPALASLKRSASCGYPPPRDRAQRAAMPSARSLVSTVSAAASEHCDLNICGRTAREDAAATGELREFVEMREHDIRGGVAGIGVVQGRSGREQPRAAPADRRTR